MTGYIAFFSVKAEAPAVSNRRGPLPVLVWDCPDQSPIIGRTQPYKPAPSTPQTIRVMMGFNLNYQTIASAMAKKIRLYTLVIEIFATDRQDAAISPMTTGLIPERAFFR